LLDVIRHVSLKFCGGLAICRCYLTINVIVNFVTVICAHSVRSLP